MKKLKKLTREQKKIVSDQGLDPKEFLSERDTPEIFILSLVKNLNLLNRRKVKRNENNNTRINK